MDNKLGYVQTGSLGNILDDITGVVRTAAGAVNTANDIQTQFSGGAPAGYSGIPNGGPVTVQNSGLPSGLPDVDYKIEVKDPDASTFPWMEVGVGAAVLAAIVAVYVATK